MAITIFNKGGDWKTPLFAAVGMTLIIMSIGEMVKALNIMPTVSNRSISTLIIMSLAIAIIGVIMVALTRIKDPTGLLVSVTALTIMLLGLSTALRILNGIAINISVIASLGLAVAMIVGISAAFAVMQNVDVEKIIAIAVALTIVIGVISTAIAVISTIASVNPLIEGALYGLAAIFMSISATIASAGLVIIAAALGIMGVLYMLTAAVEKLSVIDLTTLANEVRELASAFVELGASALRTSLALTGVLLKTIPLFAAIGLFAMTGLNKGLIKGSKKPIETVEKVAGGLTEETKDVLVIASPSKVFRWIGNMIMNGLATGIVEKIPVVGRTLYNGLNSISEWMLEKAEDFEKVGDSWANAFGVLLGGGLEESLLGSKDTLSEFLDEMISGEDITEELSKSLEDVGLSAEGASAGTDKLADSMSNALDMFTEFNDEANMAGRDVIRTFMGQLEGVSKWRAELESLSSRGLGEVILQDLEALGPQGYEKVHAFYNMTNSELATMNILYKQKLAIQKSTSKSVTKSFKGLTNDIGDTMEEGIDNIGTDLQDNMANLGSTLMTALKKQMDYEKIVDQVAVFRDNIADRIRSSMSIFEAVNEQEEVSAEELLDNMKAQVKHVGKWASMITEMASKGFDEGLVATLTEMGPESYSKVAAFLTMNEEQIAEANKLYADAERVPEYGADKIVKAFAQAGFTASMGLTDSFLEGLDPEVVEQALGDLARTSISTLLYELENPKSAFEIGDEWAGNFATGLETKLDQEKENIQKKVDEIKDIMSYDAIDEENPINGDAASIYKAYGSKEMEEYRKSEEALAEIEKNREKWNQKKAQDLDVMYHQEMRKTGTPSKRRNFIYKTDNATDSDKALLELVRKWYGTNYSELYKTFSYTNGGKGFKLDVGKLVSEEALQSDKAPEGLADALRSVIDRAQGNIRDDVFDTGVFIIDTTADGLASNEALKSVEDASGEVQATIIKGTTGGGGDLNAIYRGDIIATDLGKTMINVGGGVGEAAATGMINDGIPLVEEAGTEMGNSLITSFAESLRDGLAGLMDAIINSDDDVSSPTITPVLDGSGFRDSIRNFIKDTPFDFSASMKIDASGKDRDSKLNDNISKLTDKGIVSALTQIKDSLDQYISEAGNLNVVMDTGALVGQLTPSLDYSLGKRTLAAGRGII